MQIIGLTGHSGGGKSTACKVFAQAGFGIVDCDRIARQVTEPGQPCLAALCDAFSDAILCADGTLNRKKLAKIAFGDEQKLATLNGITHHYILEQVEQKLVQFEQDGVQTVILDAPTLFESGLYQRCGRVIAILAPRQARFSRILVRDTLTPDAANLRLDAQKDDAFYVQRADIVVMNDSTPAAFEEKIHALVRTMEGRQHK